MEHPPEDDPVPEDDFMPPGEAETDDTVDDAEVPFDGGEPASPPDDEDEQQQDAGEQRDPDQD